MMKKFLLSIVAVTVGAAAYAQTGVQSNTPYGIGKDSIDCVKNMSFYKTYAKSNNYVDAYTFWKRVYDNCPAASKDTYVVGVEILKWNIENAETPEKKDQFVKELMGMYDTRIKYFGDDPDYGVDYIMGSKIADYVTYFGERADYSKIYDELKPVVLEKQSKTDPLALYYYSYASLVKLSNDPSHKEQYVKDHFMVDGFYAQEIAAAKAAGNASKVESYEGFKQSGEAAFAASGAADCETMERIYAPQIEEKKTDKEFLSTVVALLQGVRCTESPIYFAASEHLYNIEPSAKAALGIASKAYKDGKYDRAEKFYKEAISMSEDNSEKGEVYYMLAVMAYDRGQFAQARSYANSAMSNKKGFGAPMLLIATMYASSARNIYPDDPIRQRIVYCLVVDKASQAKSIDSSITNEANRLIGQYSQHYPSKEDIFMHPDLNAGDSFTVGGWIGETTTIRTK